MSQKNEISIVVSPADLATINGLISQLKTVLTPYTKALTKDEIRGITKMGDKTVAFVSKVKDYVITNPEFVPTDMMNVTDFNIDVDAVNTLSPISKSISQINEDLKDTMMLCGNEALLAALMYYGNVKFKASNNVPSAKSIYEDLKKRFVSK